MIKTLSEYINSRVLHLSSWPSLSSLSQETVPDITRICALLARRPSVGMLVPVLLRMPPPVAYSLLEMLYTGGHIYADRTPESAEPALCDEELADSHEPAVISFISRLWKRLTPDDARA
ncbi:MAG: hypothetical protein NTZ64_18705 [Polaromonas sp.]|nr:hypothetical protein [Polaromonas sp.]